MAVPLREEVAHLSDITEHNRQRERAMKWFFTKKERDQDLRKGFYAHPNIGCIFFQNFGENQELRHCLRDIQESLTAEREVRIAVVGSVFGGTGAAGIPTIMKVIQDHCGGPKANLHFCGVLITPYFSVPPKREENGNIPIDSDSFKSNTRSALRYYQFTDQFERIYLVGKTSLDFVNPRYADGGVGQNNKPHIVELFAAMAVRDFLESGSRDRRTEGDRKIQTMIIRPEDAQRIGWNSPFFDQNFRTMADMVRAQAILEVAVKRYVDAKRTEKMMGRFQWYKAFFMEAGKNGENLDAIQDYGRDFLEWMYFLQYRFTQEESNAMQRDPGISLCGSMIEELLNELHGHGEIANSGRGGELNWKELQEKFDGLVTVAQNVEYVVKKVFLLMSALGVAKPIVGKLGSIGLFMRLFELAGEKE